MTIALRQRPLARVVQGIVRAAAGCWLDPSDMTTMYQDAAGTTPVTAVEQPVGLMLDKSRGMMLGPELVSNGDFSNGLTGWTTGVGISVANGELVCATVSNERAEQPGTYSPNKTYVVTLNIRSYSSGSAFVTIGRGASVIIPFPQTLGNKTIYVKSGSADATLRIYPGGIGVGGSLTIDNISVRELYGNHATQSITASQPTLSARYNLLTKTEDFSDAAWTKQAAGTATAPVVTNNYGVAPDGSITAARLQLALNGGTTTTDRSCLLQQPALIPGAAYASTFWVKSNTAQSYVVQQRLGLTAQNITIDQTWRAYTYSQTVASDNTNWLALRGAQVTSDAADILIWHPQLIIGATTGPYQRVNTATDYDTDERYFHKYLRFDGVDDYLNLPYMGLYAGGEMSIIAARNAVSQSTDTYIISERSTTDADTKYFPSRQLANGGNMDAYISDDAGAVVLDTVGSAFGGAADKVIRSVVDTGSNIKLHKNGALAADDNYTRAGTLTLNNTTIGASVSTTTSNYASMKLYGLIITKKALSPTQRIKCERYAASKVGVIL